MNMQWRDRDIRWGAVALSLLASLYVVYVNPVPNTDAFIYLRTAEIFLAEGAGAAAEHYPWLTYSVLIALLHSATGLDMLTAARILNAVFYAIVVWNFIAIAREMNASRRFTLIAAACVLLYPQLNEYRHYLIRDIAYLGISLLALLQLIRLNASGNLRHALGFCVACLLAAIFRPEAAAYLLAAPFALLFNQAVPLRVRVHRLLLTLMTVGIALAAGLLVTGAMGLQPLERLRQGFSVYEPFLRMARSIIDGGSPELAEAIFHEHAAIFSGQYITLFLMAGLLTILLVKLFTGFGWVYLLTLAYGVRKRFHRVPAHLYAPMIAYLLIALGILFAFVFVTRFMTTRYTLLFCMILVLLVPMIVERLWQAANTELRQKRFRRLAGVTVLYLFVDSFISFGRTNNYEFDVGAWAASQPPEVPVITNHAYIAYKAGISDYDRTPMLIDAERVSAAPPGSRLVINLRGENAVIMQQLEEQGVVTAERYYPDADKARMGIYRRTQL